MAQWIVIGQPNMDPWMFNLRCLHPHAERRYTYATVEESYNYGYAVHYPAREFQAGRPLKTGPIHGRLADGGAVFGARNGWECPFKFVRQGPAEHGPLTFGRP